MCQNGLPHKDKSELKISHTRAKLINFSLRIARIEVFLVYFFPIRSDSQGSIDILYFGTGPSHVKCDAALSAIVFDIKVGDLDCGAVQTAGETGGLQNICTQNPDRQSSKHKQLAKPPHAILRQSHSSHF